MPLHAKGYYHHPLTVINIVPTAVRTIGNPVSQSYPFVGSSFPNQELNPHWQLGALTTDNQESPHSPILKTFFSGSSLGPTVFMGHCFCMKSAGAQVELDHHGGARTGQVKDTGGCKALIWHWEMSATKAQHRFSFQTRFTPFACIDLMWWIGLVLILAFCFTLRFPLLSAPFVLYLLLCGGVCVFSSGYFTALVVI